MPMNSTTMNQVRATWSGFVGGPGVSTFYFDGSGIPPAAAVRTFFAALNGSFPGAVSIQVQAAGEGIAPSDGTLEGSWSVGAAPAVVNGAGSGAYNSAQGYEIVWNTDEIADGRAVKGRTFVVPTAAGIFDTAGLLSAAQVTSCQNAANALIAATPHLCVWHRPKKGPKPAGGGPAPVIRAGSWAPVTSASVPRKAVVLTSRRD
jgi:hypothetical protein